MSAFVGGISKKRDSDFALIVVLFILLIIVGTAFVKW
ncbi:YjcZ family sporulation protein [Oceanobacillus saliphilus]|nr:YjcZ family sporulation protein [Oceanobacillus saliphilus]